MPNRQFQTQRERAAYALGVHDGAQQSATAPLSRAAVESMSKEEVIRRLPEIDAWLEKGMPEPEEAQ